MRRATRRAAPPKISLLGSHSRHTPRAPRSHEVIARHAGATGVDAELGIRVRVDDQLVMTHERRAGVRRIDPGPRASDRAAPARTQCEKARELFEIRERSTGGLAGEQDAAPRACREPRVDQHPRVCEIALHCAAQAIPLAAASG